jgi:hypothetical protein
MSLNYVQLELRLPIFATIVVSMSNSGLPIRIGSVKRPAPAIRIARLPKRRITSNRATFQPPLGNATTVEDTNTTMARIPALNLSRTPRSYANPAKQLCCGHERCKEARNSLAFEKSTHSTNAAGEFAKPSDNEYNRDAASHKQQSVVYRGWFFHNRNGPLTAIRVRPCAIRIVSRPRPPIITQTAMIKPATTQRALELIFSPSSTRAKQSSKQVTESTSSQAKSPPAAPADRLPGRVPG